MAISFILSIYFIYFILFTYLFIYLAYCTANGDILNLVFSIYQEKRVISRETSNFINGIYKTKI
jgi:hypothetical protein